MIADQLETDISITVLAAFFITTVAASSAQGYYDSMDAGIMDQDGQVYVMAREDDVINVAGHRLSTASLEEAMLEHPCISEAAVIGVPDEMKGELPLGLYVTTKGKGLQHIDFYFFFSNCWLMMLN